MNIKKNRNKNFDKNFLFKTFIIAGFENYANVKKIELGIDKRNVVVCGIVKCKISILNVLYLYNIIGIELTAAN